MQLYSQSLKPVCCDSDSDNDRSSVCSYCQCPSRNLDVVDFAITTICPSSGSTRVYLCWSGGGSSVVLIDLVLRSGPCEAQRSVVAPA